MGTEREGTARFAVVLASASFGVVGACLTLPGTLLPLLLDDFGIRMFEAGSMLALQPVAYLLTVLTAGWMIARVGMRVVLSLGVLTFAAGFAGFGLVSGWFGGAAMMFVSGLGFGVAEVGLNTLLIGVGGARSANLLNLTHLFFGVGSFVGPALTAQSVAAGASWRLVFLGGGAAAAMVALGWSRLRIVADPPRQPARPHAASLYSTTTLVLAAILGLYVGAEMGIGGWLTKYMMAERHVSLTYAGNTLSLYWLGLAAGRLGLGLLSRPLRVEPLLVGLTLLAAVSVVVALVVEAPWLAVVCFGLTGVGFSGIFPGVIALGGRSHPHDPAGVTTVLVTGAGLGGIIIPWSMSAIADAAGLLAGMAFYAGACALMVLLSLAVRWTAPANP